MDNTIKKDKFTRNFNNRQVEKLTQLKRLVDEKALHGQSFTADKILLLMDYSVKSNILDTLLVNNIVYQIAGCDFSKKAIWRFK